MPFLLSFLAIFALPAFAAAPIEDTYLNFNELSTHEKIGTDYDVMTLIRTKATTGIFAIHSGTIEPGTGEFARAIAGDDLNFYVLTSFEKTHPFRLHLTSNHFDDPKALLVASNSKHCLSVHGYLDETRLMKVCVGGGNSGLKKKFLDSTPPTGVHLIECTGRLSGTAHENIVNRCSEGGVQLQLTLSLRERMKNDAAFMKKMTVWARALLGY